MNNELTDITIVLDRSGSMSSVQADTIGGYNTFLKAQREAKVGACAVSLVQFDDLYEVVYSGKPVAVAPDLNALTFVPRGGTALLDAIGKTIVTTGMRYAGMSEYDRPGKVLFVIVTDGGENASREYDNAKINEMIALQRDAYKWDFIFLGANQDAISAGASLGLGMSKTMNYASNAMGTQSAFSTVSAYAVRSRGMSSGAEALVSNAIAPEDREAQTDAGAAP